jgi:pyruvate dehydrogenase E2 component (dihydrolipoamide acetyltransferase)
MAREIVMPRMGLTMETGRIITWLKQEGELVKAGEPLLEIETDKATVEIESLESGALGKIVAGPGDELPVGAVIGYLTKEGESWDRAMQIAMPGSMASAPLPVGVYTPGEIQSAPSILNPKKKASPAARRLAQQLGVSLERVSGSGPQGRIVAWNVAEAAHSTGPAVQTNSGQSPARISPVAQRVASELGVDLTNLKGSGPAGILTRRDVELAAQKFGPNDSVVKKLNAAPEIEPLTRVQRLTAERMAQSFSTAPHFYLHVDVDARQMVLLRQQLLPRMEKRDGVHLTFTDLLIYFCAHTLPKHPLVMAQWATTGLKKFNHANIGVAVETENGLVVPVIRAADSLGLIEIARQRIDLAERARQGKLLPDEFEEGVFTITNLGMYSIDSFDAILNPPQAAILAVGQIKQRALVENGQLIPAAMLNLSLSVDHRVLDGARASRFLSDLVETIELPGLSMA